MRQLLVDDRSESLLTDRGYAVIDALPPDAVRELLELRSGRDDHGFTVSMSLAPGARKSREVEALQAVYDRHVASHFSGMQVAAAGFAVKAAEGESPITGHLDWSMVDETVHRSLNAWIALVDTDERNGALAVVPGSHRLPLTRRGSRTRPPMAAAHREVAELLEVVPMAAGQAIVYEPRLIHGSSTNTSGRPRVAATLALVPSELAPIHLVGVPGQPDAPLRQVQVDPGFFQGYALDPATGFDPRIEELVDGRPFETVPATPALTPGHLAALRRPRGQKRAGRRLLGLVRR